MKIANIIVIMKRTVIAIIFISIVVWAYNYYSEEVFYINDVKYLENTQEHNNITSYTDSSGNEIRLITHEDYRELVIASESYRIEETAANVFEDTFIVTYPSGKTYTVRNINSNDLVAYDENDEMFISIVAYSNNGPIFSSNEQYYHPSSLVAAAYKEYHEQQGNLIIFILSLIFFLFSWLLFSNKSLQLVIFHISYGLSVVDPEPSDFYFATTKMGAVGGMIASFVFFIQSLG